MPATEWEVASTFASNSEEYSQKGHTQCHKIMKIQTYRLILGVLVVLVLLARPAIVRLTRPQTRATTRAHGKQKTAK